MKTQWIAAFLILSAFAGAAYADDGVDSKLHSAVSDKVQQDHQADVKSGLVGSPAGSPARNQTTSAGTGVISHSGGQPAQVQALSKKKATPPPPPPVKAGPSK